MAVETPGVQAHQKCKNKIWQRSAQNYRTLDSLCTKAQIIIKIYKNLQ